MWSYYANSHKGFCIEFKQEFIEASKVKYQVDIPDIKIDDLLSILYETNDNEKIGEKIWDYLRIKLIEWKHENEYRFHASDEMEKSLVLNKDNYKIFKYPSKFVSSIIFGCRTDQRVKDYIIENYQYDINYKEAIPGKSKIKIVPYT